MEISKEKWGKMLENFAAAHATCDYLCESVSEGKIKEVGFQRLSELQEDEEDSILLYGKDGKRTNKSMATCLILQLKRMISMLEKKYG